MSWQHRLKRKLEADEWEIRLTNWGRWNRKDNTFYRLNFPAWCDIMAEYYGESRTGLMVADIDAEHIEYIVSSLNIAGRNDFGRGEIYSFVLKLEFIEKPENAQRPVSERARDMGRKYKVPCSIRTYQRHLLNAKRAVFTFAEPLYLVDLAYARW